MLLIVNISNSIGLIGILPPDVSSLINSLLDSSQKILSVLGVCHHICVIEHVLLPPLLLFLLPVQVQLLKLLLFVLKTRASFLYSHPLQFLY